MWIDDPVARSRIVEILASAGIDLAVVHGSRARRGARADSDLDVGVLAADARPLSYRVMGAIALELTSVLGIEVDVADLSTPDAIFRFEVARCTQPIFERRPGAFADFLARAMIDYSDIQRFLPELIAGVARVARREAAMVPEPREPSR
jgi:predicted nucleotidyltransferase